MSTYDAVTTFAHGLALGLFYGAFAVLVPCLLFAFIFWAQDRRARQRLPRQRPEAARSVSPPPVAASASQTDAATPPEEIPTGVHLIEWRAARRRERGAA